MIIKRRKYFNAPDKGSLVKPLNKSASIVKPFKPNDGLKELPNPKQEGKAFEAEVSSALNRI